MASSSIRVEEKTVSALRKLSETEQRPIGQIVTDLVERYQEEKFWQAMHDGFAALRQDPAAWQFYRTRSQHGTLHLRRNAERRATVSLLERRGNAR